MGGEGRVGATRPNPQRAPGRFGKRKEPQRRRVEQIPGLRLGFQIGKI